MSFGDVDMSSNPVRPGGEITPGAGGWPTIAYFNKETGYQGRPYQKKTTKPVCQELGDVSTMTQFVLDAGGVSESDLLKSEL